MNVYLLRDPNDLIIRYIGLTNKLPAHRLNIHVKDARTRKRKGGYLSEKDRWILGLLSANQKPICICLVQNLDKELCIAIEHNIIIGLRRIKDGGKLLNVQPGGFYESDKASPWNRGLKDCYNEDYMYRMKINQLNRKDVFRFDLNGNLIDVWQSIRTMCAEQGFDRRTVQRCLEKRRGYHSHKGFLFSYSKNDIPEYRKKKGKRHKKRGYEK